MCCFLSKTIVVIGTHSLGFFLGPGRPLSRMGALGSIDGGARFRTPPAAAPPLFFLPSTLGGANVLLSVASLPGAGTGVAFDSDDLSADSGGRTIGVAAPLMDVVDGCLVVGVSDGNRDRESGDMDSVTILLFLPDLGDTLVAVVVVDMARYRWCGLAVWLCVGDQVCERQCDDLLFAPVPRLNGSRRSQPDLCELAEVCLLLRYIHRRCWPVMAVMIVGGGVVGLEGWE